VQNPVPLQEKGAYHCVHEIIPRKMNQHEG